MAVTLISPHSGILPALWLNDRKSIGSENVGSFYPFSCQGRTRRRKKKNTADTLLSGTTTAGQMLNRKHTMPLDSDCRLKWWTVSWPFLYHFKIFVLFLQHIKCVCTIYWDVPFNVPACQMTPRTEEPSHNKWQRLKLACPWFVHYDEQIMFLHVYWLFSQILHQAFQDHTELTAWRTLRKKRLNSFIIYSSPNLSVCPSPNKLGYIWAVDLLIRTMHGRLINSNWNVTACNGELITLYSN